MAVNRVFLIKLIELVLTVICIGLHFHSYKARDTNELFVISSTFGCFFIVIIGGFIGLFTSQSAGKNVELFYSVAGCAFFVTAGALTIVVYDHSPSFFTSKEERDTGLAKACLAIINGAVFLVDALLTLRQ